MERPDTSWSYERLLQLAPDTGTLEQARKLFFAKRWLVLEGNGQYLWGVYETPYGQRIEAAVRLEPPLLKCSCKSRRRPCKHALAMVMLFLNRNEVWKVKEELPDWAQALVGQQEKATQKPKTTAPDQQKQAQRIALMDAGVAELDKWLRTVARVGLAQMVQAPEEWENLAARMVDSKLGSIARRIRLCQQWLQEEDWVEGVTAELGLLYLFVLAWQRKESLQPDQKRELLQVAGWNVRKDQLSTSNSIEDNWLVLGLSSGVEEKLKFRRTWLRGERSGQYALLLDFAFGDRGFEDHWVTGSVLKGRLLFYPGQPNIRAAFQQYQVSREPYEAVVAYADLEEVKNSYAKALGQSPWLLVLPALVDNVLPIYKTEKEQFFLLDEEKRYLSMANSDASWKLLATSAGQSISCFGEYDGRIFRPISVIHDGRVILL
ncbi:MAG: SWIM zinc finger family protein [Bacteroidota bacterium]